MPICRHISQLFILACSISSWEALWYITYLIVSSLHVYFFVSYIHTYIYKKLCVYIYIYICIYSFFCIYAFIYYFYGSAWTGKRRREEQRREEQSHGFRTFLYHCADQPSRKGLLPCLTKEGFVTEEGTALNGHTTHTALHIIILRRRPPVPPPKFPRRHAWGHTFI